MRKVAYDVLDSAETPVEGVAKLQSIIEEELKESLKEGAAAANPGSTVMKKLCGVLRKKRNGAEARSEEGKKRAAKRRANKERRYDEEMIQQP